MKQFYRLLSWVPLPLLYGVATLLAFALYRIVRYRRTVVADNLAHAFPELDTAQRLKIERGIYRHLGDLAMETLAGHGMSLDDFCRRVTFENPEVLTRFKEQQQSLLLLTGHHCNWEWLSHVIGHLMGCPVDAVYKAMHNRHFDSVNYETRARAGNPILFAEAGREILRRRREYRCFAMVADQSPFKRDKRYWHQFLGRPASFYLGPQRIAEVMQYPVVYVGMTKLRRGHYSVRFEILAEPPYEKGGTTILERYIAAVERSIRAQPETWMWSNRKWKHKPPADWQENPVTE
ncbi:MAG: lysophospholipid acyltransferase family protein [Spongiibacteraceae bacterium]